MVSQCFLTWKKILSCIQHAIGDASSILYLQFMQKQTCIDKQTSILGEKGTEGERETETVTDSERWRYLRLSSVRE